MVDFVHNFSAIVNSVVDVVQERTPVVIGREARGAILLTLVLLLIAWFPQTFSVILTGANAVIAAIVILVLASIDIVVRSVRPRGLRTQQKLQEITDGICQGTLSPQDAAAYFRYQSLPSDLLAGVVNRFPQLSPIVRENLVKSQTLTSKQLETLCSYDLDARIVEILAEAYPKGFSGQTIDKWVRKFAVSRSVVLAIARNQLPEPSSWEPYIRDGILSGDPLNCLEAEFKYVREPSRISTLLLNYSRLISVIVTIPTFLAFVVFLLLPRAASIGSLVTVSGDAYAVFAGMLVLVSMAVGLLLVFWLGITSALAELLRALGGWIRGRRKSRLISLEASKTRQT